MDDIILTMFKYDRNNNNFVPVLTNLRHLTFLLYSEVLPKEISQVSILKVNLNLFIF